MFVFVALTLIVVVAGVARGIVSMVVSFLTVLTVVWSAVLFMIM